jgi:hypothetical protein
VLEVLGLLLLGLTQVANQVVLEASVVVVLEAPLMEPLVVLVVLALY